MSRGSLLALTAALVLVATLDLAGPAVSSGAAPGGVDRHGRWTDPVSLGMHGDPVGDSCVTPTFCAVVDDYGDAAVTTDGVHWTQYGQVDPHGDLSLTDVSCATTTFCVAVDVQGYATRFDGAEWSKMTLIDPDADYRGMHVSCPTDTFCLAADAAGNGVTYDGTAWSPPVPIDPAAAAEHSLADAACGSPTLCAAVDWQGNVVSYRGRGWSSPRDLGTFWERVSCARVAVCVATDAFGRGAVYRHRRWSALTTFDAEGWLTAQSCGGPEFCAGIDSTGRSYLFDGSAWRAARYVPLANVTSLSCASRHYCLAVSYYGQASSYQS